MDMAIFGGMQLKIVSILERIKGGRSWKLENKWVKTCIWKREKNALVDRLGVKDIFVVLSFHCKSWNKVEMWVVNSGSVLGVI